MSGRLNFAESMRWLDSLYRRPFVPARQAGLTRAARLLEELGNPHRSFRSVHVAGSSGKGSTTAMVASILRSAGFHTGTFSSPHVQWPTERIAVNGEQISTEAWEDAFNLVLPVAERMEAGELAGYDLGRPTFFEVFFAVMAVHFRAGGVEWGAIETGIGGRLDATNLLTPDVAVITNVSLEHTQMLGDTIAQIAVEKSAIIKSGGHAVTAAEAPEALAVIRERSELVGAPLLEVQRDADVSVRSADMRGQRIVIRGGGQTVDARLALPGAFQATNAATAFLAAVSLQDRGVSLTPAHISQGLESARIAGRLEVVQEAPMVILDGAHNPAAAAALATALGALLGDRSAVIVFAAMNDKDIEAMVRALAPLATEVICTVAPGTERAASPDRSARAFAALGTPTVIEPDADAAIELGIERAGPGNALLVCGSLYLVGHARRRFVPEVGRSE